MRISDYKAALPYLFEARITPMVIGRHGIGKSTAPDQFAQDGGHKLFNLRLGNMEIGDLLGLPSTEGGVTSFNMPDWLREVFAFAEANPTKWAIIHLDEINRVRKDMLSPVFQIALDYRLHTFVFPDNVRCIASANPPTEDYQGVTDIRDNAFLDRFCIFELTPSTDEWLDYQRAIGSADDMVLFYSQHPSTIEHIGASFSVDELIKPSRRSSEAAMRLYKLGAPERLIYGCVGSDTGRMFYAWLQKNKTKAIRAEQVRNDWKKVKKDVEKLVKNGEVAALKTICSEMTDYYRGVKSADDISDKEAEVLRQFYDTLPEDLAYGQILVALRASEPLMLSDFGSNEKYSKKWLATVQAKPELKESAPVEESSDQKSA